MTQFRLVSSIVTLQILFVSYLRADGITDTYTLINRVFGGTAVEVPDCANNVKHISQEMDSQLNRQVFVFDSHVNEDDDRCQKSDRQRTEIKPQISSQNSFKGFYNETVSLSWNLKLDAGFQASKGFTCVHQLKPTGGNDSSMPIIALILRKGSPDTLQVIYVGPNQKKIYLGTTPLDQFKGTWFHVAEKVKYSTDGRYSVNITRMKDGVTLYSLTRTGINMWRTGVSFVRPKWGIYRSLVNKSKLRDEIVLFDNFCLGKGSYSCL